ncbi:hypothetical protein PR048_004847 [Dryococelus australis]|uniref:Uncharacterized protein n=1 Tax=Dryococelus australis TaxID=614101 RepID=A0ABQ9I709_9NEOP|nr:hypothetical protein PR048_004847 [Dryococelus australis]
MLRENEMKKIPTIPYTPDRNGRSKRENKTLVQTARSIMHAMENTSSSLGRNDKHNLYEKVEDQSSQENAEELEWNINIHDKTNKKEGKNSEDCDSGQHELIGNEEEAELIEEQKANIAQHEREL